VYVDSTFIDSWLNRRPVVAGVLLALTAGVATPPGFRTVTAQSPPQAIRLPRLPSRRPRQQ